MGYYEDEIATDPIFDELSERWNPTRIYTHRPSEWCRDVAGDFLWSKQREIAQSVADNRYTAVYSAHDLGKSKIAADIIAWWIASHPPGEAFVVSTAPTAAQVSAIMWREVSKVHTKAGLLGKINRAGYPQWFIGSELVGYGRKPADYEESAFQGIHARYVLIVVDEACGVAKHLFDSVDALATNEHARVLAIGNPDDPGSHFASVCKPDSGWNVIQLDGLRSPNMTKEKIIGYRRDGFGYENPRYPMLKALMEAEGIPYTREKIPAHLVDLLISPLWIEERIQRWAGVSPDLARSLPADELRTLIQRRCAASPIFQAKVRGQFPTSATTGVIPLGWVQAAINRWHELFYNNAENKPASLLATTPGRKVLGLDVGGEGEDETVFAIRYGNLVEKLIKYRIGDTMEIADNASVHLQEPGSIAVTDVIGIGAGVHNALNRYKRDAVIVGRSYAFNAAAQSVKKDDIGEFRFRNDRAAAWWNLREALDPSKGSTICLPDDERMLAELVSVKYKLNVGGIIQIESKDEIRKRLGRSTDSADAVVQAFWVDAAPMTMEAFEWGDGGKSGIVRYDGYDPFTDADLSATPGFGGTGSDFSTISGSGWDL